MSRGNASINNLLATAQAARDKQLAYNDQAASYDWNLSAKTQDDFARYKQYLTKRQGETQDPSKQLTAQQKIVDAQRTFSSAEIGRQTMSVLYGESDNRTKYAKINALMDQAAQTGDAELVQTLDGTRARLTKTIQDEEQAAADRAASAAKGAADKAAAGVKKGYDAQVKELKNAQQHYDTMLKTGKMNPSEYAAKLAQVNSHLMDAYNQGEANDIPSATAAKEGFSNDPKYLKFNVDNIGNVSEKISRGEDPFAAYTDQYGITSAKDRKINDRDILTGPDGKPLRDANGVLLQTEKYLSGSLKSANATETGQFEYKRKGNMDVNSPYQHRIIDTNMVRGNEQGIDPITGARLTILPGDIHTVGKPQVAGTDKTTGKNTYELDRYGNVMMGEPIKAAEGSGIFDDVGKFLANKPGDNTLQNDFNATTKVLGGILDQGARKLFPGSSNQQTAVQNMVQFGDKKRADEAVRVAASQRAALYSRIQEANRAAEAQHQIQLQQQAAARQPQVTKAAIANAKPVGGPLYNANPYQTPAQNFKQGQAAGGGILGGLQNAGLVPKLKPWYQL